MKLGYLIIYVPDVQAAVAFYEAAFSLKRRFVHESGTYAEMETGTTALAFASEQMMLSTSGHGFTRNRMEQTPAGAEIALIVNDVSDSYSRAVAHGAAPVLQPTEKPWGQTVSYVRDLNGFLVEVCSEVRN